jgi:hypothetical protein
MKSEDISAAEQWMLDEIIEQIPVPLTAFRHVLMSNADVLLPAICDSLGAQIGPVNGCPRLDFDGTPYMGPDHYEDPDWFRRIWSIPENQDRARRSHKLTEGEACMIVPLERVEGILEQYVERDPEEMSTEECVDWLISYRHLAPWMIVLLDSEVLTPLLFISEETAIIQKVAKTVREVSPASLISVWTGTETTLKLNEIGKLELRSQKKLRRKGKQRRAAKPQVDFLVNMWYYNTTQTLRGSDDAMPRNRLGSG